MHGGDVSKVVGFNLLLLLLLFNCTAIVFCNFRPAEPPQATAIEGLLE